MPVSAFRVELGGFIEIRLGTVAITFGGIGAPSAAEGTGIIRFELDDFVEIFYRTVMLLFAPA